MANSDGPEGVGGWMWLFLFGFGLVSAFSLIFGTAANLYGDSGVAQFYGDRWFAVQLGEWSIAAATLALIAYTIWRLFNDKRPRTVRLTIIAIPLVTLVFPIIEIVMVSVVGGVTLSAAATEVWPQLIQGTFYSAVWCTYFNVSKRVKNTYDRREEEELANVLD